MRMLLWLIALRSDQRFRVGALYIQGTKWATGYNKSASYGEHAEDRAIRNFELKYGVTPIGGTMFCTYSPCSCCTKTLEKHAMKSKYVAKYKGSL